MNVRIESFTDSRGIVREGYILHIYDHGGSDISYKMRGLDGSVYMVSGSRIKSMQFQRMGEMVAEDVARYQERAGS